MTTMDIVAYASAAVALIVAGLIVRDAITMR